MQTIKMAHVLKAAHRFQKLSNEWREILMNITVYCLSQFMFWISTHFATHTRRKQKFTLTHSNQQTKIWATSQQLTKFLFGQNLNDANMWQDIQSKKTTKNTETDWKKENRTQQKRVIKISYANMQLHFF